MKKFVFEILCLMLLGIAALGEEKSKAPVNGNVPANGPEAAITKIAREYEAAFNKGDAQALGAMFTQSTWRALKHSPGGAFPPISRPGSSGVAATAATDSEISP